MPEPWDRTAGPADAELVKRAQDGDLEAFGDLVRRHHPRVAGLCASLLPDRSEVDDAAQEVFIKAHRSLEKFHGRAQFSTWLYRVTVNHCHDVRRKTARRRSVSLDALIEERGEAAGVLPREAAASPDAEEAELVGRALENLPGKYREALALRAQGLSYEEICAALECSLDSLKARLRRVWWLL